MKPKINQQGQKYYEVLSEEYIKLKEKELLYLNNRIYTCIDESLPVPKEWYTEIQELQSHIEDLKAEL